MKYSFIKKDKQGRFRISSLFWETRNQLAIDALPLEEKNWLEPVFSIKDNNYSVTGADGTSVTYPSLRKIYMSYDHVPGFEYQFAQDVFGSWEHWRVLSDSSTLRDLVIEWRSELSIRIKANALKKLMTISKSTSAVGANAARYLADEGYVPKKVGRTTKEEKMRIQKIDAGVKETLLEDMERIGMKVINGTNIQ